MKISLLATGALAVLVAAAPAQFQDPQHAVVDLPRGIAAREALALPEAAIDWRKQGDKLKAKAKAFIEADEKRSKQSGSREEGWDSDDERLQECLGAFCGMLPKDKNPALATRDASPEAGLSDLKEQPKKLKDKAKAQVWPHAKGGSMAKKHWAKVEQEKKEQAENLVPVVFPGWTTTGASAEV